MKGAWKLISQVICPPLIRLAVVFYYFHVLDLSLISLLSVNIFDIVFSIASRWLATKLLRTFVMHMTKTYQLAYIWKLIFIFINFSTG